MPGTYKRCLDRQNSNRDRQKILETLDLRRGLLTNNAPNTLAGCRFHVGLFAVLGAAAKDGHDVFGGDNKQLIIGFEVDRDRIFGMKQHFVVLLER